MTEQNGVSESIRIAHLTMLQGVMARMGSNSFALKALSATFGSAAIAIMATAQKPSPYYAVAALVPILVFGLWTHSICVMSAATENYTNV